MSKIITVLSQTNVLVLELSFDNQGQNETKNFIRTVNAGNKPSGLSDFSMFDNDPNAQAINVLVDGIQEVHEEYELETIHDLSIILDNFGNVYKQLV